MEFNLSLYLDAVNAVLISQSTCPLYEVFSLGFQKLFDFLAGFQMVFPKLFIMRFNVYVLIFQSHTGQHSEKDKLFRNVDNDLKLVLKHPWSHEHALGEHYPLWKSKCSAVQVFSKTEISNPESDFEVWDWSIVDESDHVRMEAVISMPLIVFWSGAGALKLVFQKLK